MKKYLSMQKKQLIHPFHYNMETKDVNANIKTNHLLQFLQFFCDMPLAQAVIAIIKNLQYIVQPNCYWSMEAVPIVWLRTQT